MKKALEHFGHHLEGSSIAFPRHHPLVLVLDLGFSRLQLPQEHDNGLQHIERFKARNDDGLSSIRGDPFIRTTPDHR